MFQIFSKLGGEEAALQIIAQATGKPVTRVALQRWRYLGVIPPVKAVHLLTECQRRGISATHPDDCIDLDAPGRRKSLSQINVSDQISEAAQ